MNDLTPIRITIPHNQVSNLDDFRRMIKGGLKQAGCDACCSGIDIFYQRENMFRISDKLAVSPIVPKAFSLPAEKPTLTFEFDAAVSKDITRLMPALEKMLDIAGCPQCHSSLDLLFRDMGDVLQVQTFGKASL